MGNSVTLCQFPSSLLKCCLVQYLGRNTTKWKTPADQYMSQRIERSSKVSSPSPLEVFMALQDQFMPHSRR